MTTVQDFRNITANQTRSLDTISKRADLARQIDYFQKNVGKITSIDGFLKDDKIYRFVMEAFDLSSQIYAKGLIRKILEGGVSDTNSLANRMNDAKFKEMATVLAFKEADGKTLQEPKIVQAIVDRFKEVKLEEQADSTNPAVRLALYFQRKSGSITNWYQVMADNALRKVVFTNLGWPDSVATQDLDTLVKKLGQKINIKDFKDSTKVKSFLNKFAAMYDMQNTDATSTATSPYASMSVISSKSRASIISIDPSVLQTLTTIKRF